MPESDGAAGQPARRLRPPRRVATPSRPTPRDADPCRPAPALAEEPRVAETLAAIEKVLDALVASHMALLRHLQTAGPALPRGLGVGHRLVLGMTPPGAPLVRGQAIAAHCQKQLRTLRRYVAREGFPAHRWGRFTVAAPTTSRIGCLFVSGRANSASRSPPKPPSKPFLPLIERGADRSNSLTCSPSPAQGPSPR